MLAPKLKYRGAVPYGGGFRLEISDKGFVGEGTTFSMLMDRIRAYRHANGLPNGLGLEDEVECEICKRYPQECHETDVRVPYSRAMSWQEVVQGTRMMVKFKSAGTPLVPRQEAERRAQICSNCPLNFQVNFPCPGRICGELQHVVQSIIGNEGTPYDGRLKSCGICGCYLTASIWIPLDIQTSVLSNEQKEQFAVAAQENGCWKHLTT